MLIINDYKIKHNENTLVLPIEKTKNSISYKFGNNIISFDLNNFSEFNQQRKLDVYLLGYSFNYSLETGTKNYNLEKNRDGSSILVLDKLIYQKKYFFYKKQEIVKFKIRLDKHKKYQMYYSLLNIN